MKGSILLMLVSLLTFAACSDDNSDLNLQPGDPVNLVVQTTIVDDLGSVQIVATADNAVSYEFDMGDGSDLITNSTGTVDYQYLVPGSYDIEVKAFGSTGRFQRKNFTLAIVIGDEEINPNGYTSPLTYDGMTLVWQDEFEGTSLASHWVFQNGDGCSFGICGWGNNELQSYRPENTSVQDGYLIIEAKQESFDNKNYTSSRIVTKGQESFQYGRVDVRATLPETKGMWPAVWMLGANQDDVGWPWCGEIDILELAGGDDDTVIGNVFWENGNGTAAANFPGNTSLSSGVFADEFHVFSIIWTPNRIEWYLDDASVPFHAINIGSVEFDEFRNDFFFLVNIAVGGNLPGNPDATTRFPQRLIVDYIRVFQES